jgi:hypothetical protein
MIRAIRAIVHESYTPKEAYELFRDLKEAEVKRAASV